ITVTDWSGLNYFLVIFGGAVALLGFIVAERRTRIPNPHSGTPSLDRTRLRPTAWRTRWRPAPRIIPVLLCVVVVCVACLYNIDIETDPIKLWVSTSSTSYQQRQHYGEMFNPIYRSEQVIMVPKDGGNIYRSSIIKEAIRLQNVAANVTYTSDKG
ncbi:hypothetical protein PR003_g35005, partial [Phytophthora rubi]